MRLGSVLLAVGITITVLMFPSSANPAGEANFAQTLISTACTLTEAANKNNARKVKKRWTVGESSLCRNLLIINGLQAHSPCSAILPQVAGNLAVGQR